MITVNVEIGYQLLKIMSLVCFCLFVLRKIIAIRRETPWI